MKKILIAVLLGCLGGRAYAAEFSGLAVTAAGLEVLAAAEGLVVPVPEPAAPPVKMEAAGLEQIVYVPAHYGLIVYSGAPQVAANWYRSRAEAAQDMDKLLRAFQACGVKAEGAVREDYWHGWGFIVSYQQGKVSEWSAKKYLSKADAEKAALRFVVSLKQEGRRPLLPVVETEQVDNGVSYRVKALCLEPSESSARAADNGRP